jgi:hypothetical protein
VINGREKKHRDGDISTACRGMAVARVCMEGLVHGKKMSPKPPSILDSLTPRLRQFYADAIDGGFARLEIDSHSGRELLTVKKEDGSEESFAIIDGTLTSVRRGPAKEETKFKRLVMIIGKVVRRRKKREANYSEK